ncbi:MAG: heavy metal translocating P-type ATPase [Succinivibrio sp.]
MKSLKINVKGMSCSVCKGKVEKAASSVDGVGTALVNLLENTLYVEFDESRTDIKEIKKAVEAKGYTVDEYTKETSFGFSGLILLIASAVTIILMAVAMSQHFGCFETQNAFILGSIELFLCLIVMFLLKDLYVRAYKSLKERTATMDVLVSLGSLISFIYSSVNLLKVDDNALAHVLMHDNPVYFEGCAAILTAVSVGKYLESRAKGKSDDLFKSLKKLIPDTVLVKRADKNEIIPASQLKVGDVLILKAGDLAAADGSIINGSGEIDESALTGEGLYKSAGIGNKVLSGTTLVSGYLEVAVEKEGSNTLMGGILKAVEKGSITKTRIERITDKIASYFVPSVIVISILTFISWYYILGASFDMSLMFSVSVLVVSCPCALGLAVPLCTVLTSLQLARAGLICKKASVIEDLSKIKTIIFDKTGTLTTGQMSIKKLSVFEGEKEVFLDSFDSPVCKEYLKIAASLESKSSHVIKNAFLDKVSELYETEDYEYMDGLGIKARIGNDIYALVNRVDGVLVHDECLNLYLLKNDVKMAVFRLDDTLRENAFNLVNEFKKSGIKTVLLTGDSKKRADLVNKVILTDKVIARANPLEKAEAVKECQIEGPAAMVGDGINDALALKTAAVGIATGGGRDIALLAGDMVLLYDPVESLKKGFKLLRKCRKLIFENLFWALIYNLLFIPVAAGVFYNAFSLKLTPVICSVLMGISSLFVVLNSLRLLGNLKGDGKVSEVTGEKNSMSNAKKTDKVVLTIDGMMCQHCVKSVEKALRSLEGASDVSVSLENKQAYLCATNDLLSDKITAAVENLDFKVLKVDRNEA